MKKTILILALGIVVSVAPAYGQGYIFFNNYGTTTDAIVRGPGVTGVGGPVSFGYTAGLAYGFGTITDPAMLTLSGITQAFNPAIPGYFTGPIVQIPDYTGGPITFQVLAYNGADYASSVLSGSSALFTLPSIATGIQPVGEFGPALRPFSIVIPEPTTIALVGLGLVSLLVYRRRKS